MIDLELLGANGDTVVMTDGRGERYCIVVDDALRGGGRPGRPPAPGRGGRGPPPPRPPPPHHDDRWCRATGDRRRVSKDSLKSY